jgi:N-acetylglutamate synthase-like GNAT family acetyltransferase/SAM-dependent methyltransferase
MLKVGQSRASYHLRILKDAGLVTETPQGKWTYYSINRPLLLDFCRDFGGMLSDCAERRVSMSDEKSQVYDEVRRRYSRAATQCCAAPAESCCSTSEVPDLVGPSLGCGDPISRAGLQAGQDILDLGCGAGGDVIRAARIVGPEGLVYGLDMTDEMLKLAQVNKQKAGARNVVFVKGTMESIPLPDESVDVVISNCVINLSPDKDSALREIHRVLRPGGRLAVHDTVSSAPVPGQVQADSSLWSACISGSMEVTEYEERLRNAGLEAASVDVEQWYGAEISGAPGLKIGAAFVSARKPFPGAAGGARPAEGARGDLQVTGAGPARIRAAGAGDLSQVLGLLTSAGLPRDGVEEQFNRFLVTEGPDGAVSGAVGLEVYGSQGLLRSLCVKPEERGKGTGARLVEAVTAEAMAAGCSELYLLTTTADKYFERHGFARVERASVDGPVLQSIEFVSACPKTAVVMLKSLTRCCCSTD